MSGAKLIKGRWVLCGDEVIADGAVAVEGKRIVETGPAEALSRRYAGAEVIGSENSAVLPGFVNAHHHSHGVSTIQHGLSDALLESWILGFAGLRAGRVYEETLLSAAEQLRSGVTSLVDVHSGGGSAAEYEASVDAGLEAYERAGIRVAFATGTSTQSRLVHGAGQDEAFVDHLPAEVQADARALLPGPDRVGDEGYLDIVTARVESFARHSLIDVWFAPPGPQWVSDALMQQIAARAGALDTRIQTHCNESFYEKLHGDRFYGCPTVVHLERLGVLGERFSIAHGVWLTETEIAALGRSGAAVSHNPSSNLRLRAGIAPLNALLEGGVTVALGMDGTTINEDEDMFSELRLALRLNRVPHYGHSVPSTAQLFALATTGGARLMGKEKEIGRLLPGYRADLMVVDIERLIHPWTAPEVDPLELIVLRARKEDVRCVLVDGEVVMRDGAVTGFDEQAAADALAEHFASQRFPRELADVAARIRPYLEAWYQRWETPPLTPYTGYNAR